ncbi:hypothetical protein SO802_005821 [Lithocarpus litseifolius]|uniref:RNase H type-1 domain-containing protein n=1 Tax=Lithocarpus litseifolius TaxID=425828 RepID=A0AAW2DJ85_9ROSI
MREDQGRQLVASQIGDQIEIPRDTQSDSRKDMKRKATGVATSTDKRKDYANREGLNISVGSDELESSKELVGNIPEGENNTFRDVNNHRDTERPDRYHRMVWRRGHDGLEEHFSPDREEDCANMVQQLGIHKTNNLGKYLGFLFKHKGRNRNQFQSVVDKVHAKLAGWKAKCLSHAGRLVLIKAAVTPIIEYTMQCCKLPTKVCDRVDKLTRDFLWGSTKERRKLHLVRWDKVTTPTSLRGLGIFQMRARNAAILAKLCWRIASSSEAPWALMLTSKYLTLVRKLIQGPLLEGEGKKSDKEFLANLFDSSFVFPKSILKEIQGMPLAANPLQDDILIWGFSKDGSFNLQSANLLAKGRKEHNIHVQSIKKGAEFFAFVPDCSNKPPRVQVQISWKKPLAGWMKLNTDGAVFGNPIQVGGGGVLWDINCDWVAGFVRKLGSMSSVLAELWAFKYGLLLARNLIKTFPSCTVTHIFREANRCADKLANI